MSVYVYVYVCVCVCVCACVCVCVTERGGGECAEATGRGAFKGLEFRA